MPQPLVVRKSHHPPAVPSFEAFVYVSRADRLAPGDLPELVKQSKLRNTAHGLTSVLVVGGGHFLQYVEGLPIPLLQLWNRLQHDPRHTSVKLLHYAPIATRRFPDWSLEHLTGKIDQDAIHAMGKTPAALNSDAGVQFVLEALPLPARSRLQRAAGGK
jgi:Sensors of blue-light using FAD